MIGRLLLLCSLLCAENQSKTYEQRAMFKSVIIKFSTRSECDKGVIDLCNNLTGTIRIFKKLLIRDIPIVLALPQCPLVSRTFFESRS